MTSFLWGTVKESYPYSHVNTSSTVSNTLKCRHLRCLVRLRNNGFHSALPSRPFIPTVLTEIKPMSNASTTSNETHNIKSLSKREFAKRHSVSQRTVDNWRADKHPLPVLIVSARKVLFPIPEADEWVTSSFSIARGGKASR